MEITEQNPTVTEQIIQDEDVKRRIEERKLRSSAAKRIFRRSFALGAISGLLLLAILLYVFGLGRVVVGKNYKDFRNLKDAYGKFYKLNEILKDEALAEYNPAEVNDDVLREVVAGLEDPYAQYFSKEEYQQYRKRYETTYVGIGMAIDDEDGKVVIRVAAEGGPADEAGIKEDDILLKVNGKRVKDTSDATQKLTGDAGTELVLTIERDGEQQDIPVIITKLENKTVRYDVCRKLTDGRWKLEEVGADEGSDEDAETEDEFELDSRGRVKVMGYIEISIFSKDVAKELKLAVKDLKSKGCEKFVIDLRNNGGGLTAQAYKLADYLLPSSVIATEVNKDGKKIVHKSKAGDAGIDYVMLVNENSASASELVAAACQDNGITIIGKTTYGKGVTQKTHKFEDGSAVKFTVREYFRPSGEKVDGVGVIPDIEVKNEKKMLRTAFDVLEEEQ